MEYFKLIWECCLDINNSPMLKISTQPVILTEGEPFPEALHNDINILIDFDGLDDVLEGFKDVLSGKESESGFAVELFFYHYEKDTLEIRYNPDETVALFHTQEFFDMLSTYQKFRDERKGL